MPAPIEKMVTIPGQGGGPTLDGIFLPAEREGPRDGGAVVAPPHPLYGGSMENPVVCELAYACARAGLPSLRFNWRGVGASEGEATGEAEAADADAVAALEHMAETAPGPLVACGYSFGALAMARAARAQPRVRRLVLVAPPPPLAAAGLLAGFGGPVLALVGARDRLAPPEAVERLLAPARDARLVVLPEADHFFADGLAALGRAVREFLG
jgi:alpha/beta superfamily hydrolase